MSWKHERLFDEPCPCGGGTVSMTMHESDNGYSGDDYSVDIWCPACRATYDARIAPSPRGAVCVLYEKNRGAGVTFTYPREG